MTSDYATRCRVAVAEQQGIRKVTDAAQIKASKELSAYQTALLCILSLVC